MFLLWKNLLYLPVALMVYIGTPFKFEIESSLRGWSESDLKEKYTEKKRQHYLERIIPACGLIVGTLVFLALIWLSYGYILLIFPLITIILLGIDGLMIFARYIYFREEEKKAEENGTALVLQDAWKDTKLSSLIIRKREEQEKWNQEFRERSGREPNPHEVSLANRGY
jgi:hypothetical protein